MKTKLLILSIAILPLFLSSQDQEGVLEPPPTDLINGAFSKDHNQSKDEAYEYPEISEKDIVWSTTIWREIDLRQKINHHFYYPSISERDHLNPEQMSLIDVVMESIQEGGMFYNPTLRVFRAEQNAKADNEFKYGLLTQEEKNSLGEGEIFVSDSFDVYGDLVFDRDGNKLQSITEAAAFDRTLVKRWKIKEEWFFDKHRSVMDVRIVGLCPVVEIPDEQREEDMFWLYFPDYRTLLAKTKVANFTKNNAQQRSYLGIFEKRMFGSRVLQESNIMNRSISDYMVGLDALLESEKIKKNLHDFEQDLWEY